MTQEVLQDDWRDISEAPKDGRSSRVDLWIVRTSATGLPRDEYRVPDCYWDEGKKAWRSPWTRHGSEPIPRHYRPTHFRPSDRGPRT